MYPGSQENPNKSSVAVSQSEFLMIVEKSKETASCFRSLSERLNKTVNNIQQTPPVIQEKPADPHAAGDFISQMSVLLMELSRYERLIREDVNKLENLVG